MFFYVMNEHSNRVFTSNSFAKCLWFMMNQEVERYTIGYLKGSVEVPLMHYDNGNWSDPNGILDAYSIG